MLTTKTSCKAYLKKKKSNQNKKHANSGSPTCFYQNARGPSSKIHVMLKFQATKLIVEAAQRDDKAGAFPHLRPQVISTLEPPWFQSLVFSFSRKKNWAPGLDFNGTLVHLDNLQNHRKTQSHPSAGKRQSLQETWFKKNIKHRTQKTPQREKYGKILALGCG